MTGSILLYTGAFLAFVWGVAHLFPTRSIVRGFGPQGPGDPLSSETSTKSSLSRSTDGISADNRRIVAMEWITEGIALIFMGVLTGLVTFLDRGSVVSIAVYWSTFATLNILSVVSLFTGFRNSFIAFKLCPFIFTGSSALILAGSCL